MLIRMRVGPQHGPTAVAGGMTGGTGGKTKEHSKHSSRGASLSYHFPDKQRSPKRQECFK